MSSRPVIGIPTQTQQAIIGQDFATYRQVMFLVGSLIRRLGQKDEDHPINELRERFMWTRIKQHLRQNKIAPRDAIPALATTTSSTPRFHKSASATARPSYVSVTPTDCATSLNRPAPSFNQTRFD